MITIQADTSALCFSACCFHLYCEVSFANFVWSCSFEGYFTSRWTNEPIHILLTAKFLGISVYILDLKSPNQNSLKSARPKIQLYVSKKKVFFCHLSFCQMKFCIQTVSCRTLLIFCCSHYFHKYLKYFVWNWPEDFSMLLLIMENVNYSVEAN